MRSSINGELVRCINGNDRLWKRAGMCCTCNVERDVLSLHTQVDTLSDAREGQSWVIGDITVTSVRRGKGSGCAWVWVGGSFGYNVSPAAPYTRTSLPLPTRYTLALGALKRACRSSSLQASRSAREVRYPAAGGVGEEAHSRQRHWCPWSKPVNVETCEDVAAPWLL
eukprot:scaffold2916_cov70-Phaeocystis_antarctica.AAC.1